MQKNERAKEARNQLDNRLRSFNLEYLAARPTKGWIRAIRDALGMTSRQLSQRMGIAETAVSSLEKSELQDSIQIGTLRRAAEALQCDLIYAIVPKSTLEDIVQCQAKTLAAHDIAATARTMSLEGQQLPDDVTQSRIDEYAQQLIAKGRIWQPVQSTQLLQSDSDNA